MNGVKCLTCLKIVVSTHRHDFQGCDCPPATQIFVDGGDDYKKRAFGPDAIWDELSDEELQAWAEERKASKAKD